MSATLVKRSSGGGSSGPGSTAPSNGNTKSAQAMGAYAVASTATTALRKDPASLLARGYTARYLGAVLQTYTNKNINNNKNTSTRIPTIAPLSNEEMDRDFRHICAYQDAATRYHQLTYAATNHVNLNAAKNGSTSQDSQHLDGNQLDPTASSQFFTTATLPVRIDPEEEKRRLTAQKRIQRAEAVREELEQHYVALRAHYVVTTQELQSLSQESERTIETLQQSVASTAAILGYQRAKLQMTRDVTAAFQYRTHLILSGECSTAATDAVSTTGTTTGIDEISQASLSQGLEVNTEMTTTSTSEHQVPMLAAWTALEEECRRHLSYGINGNKGNSAKGTKGKQAAAAAAAATIVPWPCTMEPSTPYGIPMLLSAVSTVPEKSIAVHTGNMFGSTNKNSMTWMESHLPSLIDDDGDDITQTELDAIEVLQKEAAALEADLLQERHLNQEILIKTGQSRIQHDEWVAMISLVRQETEAVLYRHNVLLESDEVRDAIANMAITASTSVEAVSSSTTMTLSNTHDDEEEEEEEEVEEEEVEIEEEGLDEEDVGDKGDISGSNGVGVNDVKGGNDVDNALNTTASVTVATTAAAAAALEEGGASDEADDEGIEEEEGEDVDDWDTTNNNTSGNNKRSSATSSSNNNEDSEESPGGSRKRRKVETK